MRIGLSRAGSASPSWVVGCGVRLRAGLGAAVVLAFTAGCAPLDVTDRGEGETAPDAVAASIAPLSSIECSERSDRGYRRGTPFDIRVVTVDGRPVEIDTANAYYVMASAAARDGVEIRVVSGFRTMSQQEYLYYCYTSCSCNGCALAARPGYSNHQSGHALDLNTRTPGVLAWLNANAGRFGFSRTVPSEDWHWEWWGGGPGGGPCGGCVPHCEGSTIVRRDCGRGDCAAFASRCVDDALGVRCAFAFCPDRGHDTFCFDERTIGTCNDGAVSRGDCGAFGARCVDDALGARCVFYACPASGETTVCLDDRRLGTCRDGAISTGDCGAFGAGCVSDGLGARCAFYACPAVGETTVCLDERTIGTCRNGAITTGDCGAFAAYCSTAGASAARCVSAFCVASASDVPVEHDVCLPDGQIAHCNAEGVPVGARACPPESPCTATPMGARCGEAPPPDMMSEESDPNLAVEDDGGGSDGSEAVDGGPVPRRPPSVSSSCSIARVERSSGAWLAAALGIACALVRRRGARGRG
jgi:hypothetical protein